MWRSLWAWLTRGIGDLNDLRFEFNVPFATTLGLAIVLAVGLGAGLYAWPRLRRLRLRSRLLLTGLRAGALALAVFLLLDPCLVGRLDRPGDHYVIALFDDSQSMRIVGAEGLSRADRMLRTYAAERPGFERDLRGRFQLALYAFGDRVERIEKPEAMKFERGRSDLVGAVEQALQDLEGVAVSGVVLFSDGIQQTEAAAPDLERLAARGTPVFTVGVDAEAAWKDLALGELSVRRAELDQSPVVITAPVRAVGLTGEQGVVEVVREGRVIKAQQLAFDEDVHEEEVRLEFVPDKKGWLEYEARVRLAETGPWNRATAVSDIRAPTKDRVVENNVRRLLVDNRDRRRRILYFAGRPNWEQKFILRALDEDERLRTTSLIRISRAERRFVFRGRRSTMSNPLFEGFGEHADQPRYDESVFLRLGVQGPELDTGYPSHAKDLFRYDLVIWGEIEHEFFSRAQLELTREFVRKRGGTLLLLGGPNSFAEGNYAGSVIAPMLPVLVSEAVRELGRATPPQLTRRFKAEPTIDGVLGGAWALDPNPDENTRLWEELPELTGVNLFPLTRAGATVMARTASPWPDVDQAPLFAVQRYGEGRCAILATGSTWQWRMEESVAAEDTRHERFWRQLTRSLIAGVAEPVYLRSPREGYTIGQATGLDFIVRDDVYDEREGLRTTIKLGAPSGREINVPVEESLHETGLYRAEFTPEEAGTYRARLEALDEKDEVVGSLEEALLVEADQREFQKAEYDPAFLQAIAQATGGEFYPLERLSEVARRLPWTDRREPEHRRLHLGHFPGFYVLLVGTLGLEWYLRRRRGYA